MNQREQTLALNEFGVNELTYRPAPGGAALPVDASGGLLRPTVIRRAPRHIRPVLYDYNFAV
jgi:hypothetical protein